MGGPGSEAISLALQTACMAAFDAVLVHVVNLLSPGKWHGVKASMVDALHKNKTALTLDILAGSTYASCDVIFLQEAAAALVGRRGRTHFPPPFGHCARAFSHLSIRTRAQHTHIRSSVHEWTLIRPCEMAGATPRVERQIPRVVSRKGGDIH